MSKSIAFWMSDKKIQKLNWMEFDKTCHDFGYNLFKLDLFQSFETQGKFHVFLHKLTDIIASADQGDLKCAFLIRKIEDYLSKHPSIIVLDPIPNLRQLLNRFMSYGKINSTNLHKYGIFTPNFCELKSSNILDIIKQLKNAGVTYPFISKSFFGHGSKHSHEMSIVFNEDGLKDCRTPCVAQSFINHNAILYKIFIIGEKYHVVERPSLKNFHAFCDTATIHFDSGDISKADSKNYLTKLEPFERVNLNRPDCETFKRIAVSLRDAFGMDLLGVDVIIESDTGKHAIIDINAFPGYDGFPNFYEALLKCINNKINVICKNQRDFIQRN